MINQIDGNGKKMGDHPVVPLENIDKKILEVLQIDAKASLRGIADKIKELYPKEKKPSVTMITNHLNSLEDKNVIKHYIAVVDCYKIGYTDMLIFTLRINTSVQIDEIFTKLEKIDDGRINAIYQTSGAYPILCMAKCVSKAQQIDLLEKVKKIKGVIEVITQVVMRRIKEDMRVKIPKIELVK